MTVISRIDDRASRVVIDCLADTSFGTVGQVPRPGCHQRSAGQSDS